MKQYLQLLEVFTIREIKSRYKASLLGPLWIVVYPLMTTFFLSFIFQKIVKIKTEGVPYYVFLLSGLLFWNFFQQGVILAKDSLVWNRNLVTKTTFPKEVLPLSFIFSKIPDFFINLLILLIFLILSHFKINLLFLAVPFTIIPVVLFAAGIGLFFSLTNAIFRDFGRVIEFFLMMFFYTTPILYPVSFIPKKFSFFLLYFNPIALVINFTHQILFKNQIKIELLLISLIISSFIFIFGILFFRKFEKKIADLI